MCSSVEVHSEEPKPEFTDLNMNHMFLGAIYSLPDQRIRRSSSGMDPRSSTISIQSSESTNVKHDNNDGDAESLGHPLENDKAAKPSLTPESKELLLASAITREQLIDIPWIEEDAISVKTLDFTSGSTATIEVAQ